MDLILLMKEHLFGFCRKQASMRVNITWQKLIFIAAIDAAAVIIMVRNIERRASGERLFTVACHTPYSVYTVTSHSGLRRNLHLSMHPDLSMLSSDGCYPP